MKFHAWVVVAPVKNAQHMIVDGLFMTDMLLCGSTFTGKRLGILRDLVVSEEIYLVFGLS